MEKTRRIVCIVFGICMAVFVSKASTDTVTTTANSGVGSLREAVSNANPGDTICFSPSINGHEINLTSGIIVDTNVVILGNGANNTIVDGGSSGFFRILTINSGDTVKLIGLTLQNGDVSGVPSAAAGALLNEGVLTCLNTVFRGNESDGAGGAISNQGTAIFINSVISGNRAVFVGGGLYNANNGNVMFRNVTISGNTAALSSGGGVHNQSGVISFINSIVAKNTANSTGPDISGFGTAITNLGNNLIGDNETVTTPFPSDGVLIGTSAMPIDPLFIADVPSSPSTDGNLQLQCISPAIDMGGSDTSGLAVGSLDLAGSHRISGDSIDIGAYEILFDGLIDQTILSNGNNTYQSFGTLSSDGSVDRDIVFKAAEAIIFLQDFSILSGFLLEALIETCTE